MLQVRFQIDWTLSTVWRYYNHINVLMSLINSHLTTCAYALALWRASHTSALGALVFFCQTIVLDPKVVEFQSNVKIRYNAPNPRYMFLGRCSMKHLKYPCFCILLLEFGVKNDMHNHENTEVLCSNRYKSPKEMSGNSGLLKHGKHVDRFNLTKTRARYLKQTI